MALDRRLRRPPPTAAETETELQTYENEIDICTGISNRISRLAVNKLTETSRFARYLLRTYSKLSFALYLIVSKTRVTIIYYI